MSLTVALILIGTGYTVFFAALAYLFVRASRPVVNPLGSPPCDRCGKDTEKPWLWGQQRTQWHCAECDQWLTDQLFPDMGSPDYDRAQHTAFLQAYVETRKRPTA